MPQTSASFDPLRYQIREHTRVPMENGDGVRHEYGAVLWDGDDVSLAMQLRSTAAMERADELAENEQRDVAVGLVSSTDPDGLFQGIYFTRPSVVPGVPELRVIAGGAR